MLTMPTIDSKQLQKVLANFNKTKDLNLLPINFVKMFK
jgi:hypothetical protein